MITEEALWQERIFGQDVIRTRRDRVPIHDLIPNERQPRQGEKKDPELRRQIQENGGVFEPLLVEPDPDREERYRIIDGERRWFNSNELIEELEAAEEPDEEIDKFRFVPIETTDRTLSDEERYRIWIYIHRQRKEWSRKEKEGAAYNLARYMDRARAASILGISMRELDKLIETFQISERIKRLSDPDASITWAREIMNLSPRYRPDEVQDALINKVNAGMLRNSKEVRQLRRIVPHTAALEEFLSETGSVQSAVEKLPPESQQRGRGIYGGGILKDMLTFSDQLARYPWTELAAIRDDPEVHDAIAAAEERLTTLRKALGRPRARRRG